MVHIQHQYVSQSNQHMLRLCFHSHFFSFFQQYRVRAQPFLTALSACLVALADAVSPLQPLALLRHQFEVSKRVIQIIRDILGGPGGQQYVTQTFCAS